MGQNCDECTFLNCDPVCKSRSMNRALRKMSHIEVHQRLTAFITDVRNALTWQALFSWFSSVYACDYFYLECLVRDRRVALFRIQRASFPDALSMEDIHAACRDQSRAEKRRRVR